ncbi:MAG: hypothetical protein M3314_11225, partial [Actinomycetota bacterium]|nr:hypothetical protein [Actinomycetota bacterium]
IRAAPAPGPWRALALQPDGKLVVAGGGNGMVVARYLADGTPDLGFGTAGKTALLAGSDTVAYAVGVFVDSTIYLAGGKAGDIALARVDATGLPVAAFGAGGTVVVDLGSDETAYGLALSTGGVVTVVGEYADMGFAGSFLATGQPNPAAGSTGITFTDVGFDAWRQKLRAVVRNPSAGFLIAGYIADEFYLGSFSYSDGRGWFIGRPFGFSDIPESATRAVRQADGKVIVAGETGGMLGMVRHNLDTTLDPTYGHGGRVVSDLISSPRALALDGSGRAVVAGAYRGKLALLRFTPRGALDVSFGVHGRSVSDGPVQGSLPGGLLVLPDGKILVVGATSAQDGVGGWVGRFHPNGSPDLGFGKAGWISRAFKGGGSLLAIRLLRQGDGKIVLVGFQNLVIRLNPDGSRDTGFGQDGTVTVETVAAFQGAALLTDGRILLGSAAYPPWDRAVTRLLPNGQVDASWDSQTPYGLPGVGQVVLPMPDGRVLALAGGAGIRLLANGEADRSFGDNGRMTLAEQIGTALEGFLDPDGTLFIAGGEQWPARRGFKFARTRTGRPGLGAPLAWGSGAQGQLGGGTTTDRTSPGTVSGLTHVASISAGTYHNLVLRTDGTVWAWGWNALGQLGDGTTTNRSTPVPVATMDNVIAVAAGTAHSLAVKADGSVWAWGWNGYGQLGDGTTVDRHVPVRVATLSGGTVSVAAGAVHSLALDQGGRVWAWGWNAVGQLGDGTSIDRHTPVLTKGLEGPYWRYPASGIAAGAYHSLAVSTEGAVLAWGWNGYGQLGDGTTTERHLPVVVRGLSAVRTVSAGWLHSLAVLADGTVRAWGWNAVGQLGDGTSTDRHTPVPIPRLTDVRSASAGVFHSLVIRMDGSVWTWGWNGTGALGTGGTSSRWAPAVVATTGAAVGGAGGLHSVVS